MPQTHLVPMQTGFKPTSSIAHLFDSPYTSSPLPSVSVQETALNNYCCFFHADTNSLIMSLLIASLIGPLLFAAF